MLCFIKNKYFHLIGGFFILSFVGVFGKMAAMSGGFGVRFLVFVGIQIIILGTYALIWQQVLKKFDLVEAMAFRGVVVILSLVWAVVFFQESITIFNIIGSIVIVIGIYIVSTGESKLD